MKKNPALVGFLVVLAILGGILLLYFNVLDKKNGYLVANPSNEQLTIQIDKEHFTVAPQQNVRIPLDKGQHRIKFTYKGTTTDTLIEVNRGNGLLNPTRTTYYTFTRPYGVRENVDSLFRSTHLTIDEKVYFGKILKSDRLFIENFYYNLDENYPKVFLKSDKETNLMKIFNEEDFKQFYFENYE